LAVVETMKQTLIISLVFFLTACAGAEIILPKLPGTIVPIVNKTFTPSVADYVNEPGPTIFVIDPNNYEWSAEISGLTQPLDVQNAGDGSNRLFIVERAGVIKVVENGTLLDAPFLDIRDRVEDGHNEQGLLGLAFHPDYEKNGYFYVNYIDLKNNTVIARFRISEDANIADPASEKTSLYVSQPFHNNNGGMLAFGVDGFLYIATGDGGDWSDPYDNAQNTHSLLGKILRIDVDRGAPYAIPADNPFANGEDGAPEVWVYGLRNPWRFTIDPLTGNMFIGDVGQFGYEEVDFIEAGSPNGLNFGWDYREGFHRFNSVDEFPKDYDFVEPIFDYDHKMGCAIISGVVYRSVWENWRGLYLAGDYCTGKIWAMKQLGSEWQVQLLYETKKTIAAFGADEAGDIYIVDHLGTIFHLVKK